MFNVFNLAYLFVLALISLNKVGAVCPAVKTVDNFDPQRFSGKWYEIEKYPNIWEAGQKCVTANYEMNPNGTLTVLNQSILKLINYPISIRGIATPNPNDPAKLTVRFSTFGRGNLWVLETDYQNYALTYSCVNLPFLGLHPISIENAWILSRTPKIDPQIVELLKSKLSSVNSPTYMFYATDQSNCPNVTTANLKRSVPS